MKKIISDEQLVDYLLNLLPSSQHQIFKQQIDTDSELQQRLHTWQNALFIFHTDTKEKTAPKHVWQGIERQLFADETQGERQKTLPRFLRINRLLTSTTLAFSLLFGATLWLQNWGYRPDSLSQYHASLSGLHFPITLWEVEGNRNNITFTSIRNVSERGRECVAWLKQGDNTPIKLGVIPDTGDKTAYRIILPEHLVVKAGDRVIVAMVANGDTQLPPTSEQHIVELSKI